METENIIILKDLEIVYPSLYELFNQSYTYLLNIKFTRLGKSKSLSMVNDKFKVIVLVDKENIPIEDPPFINSSNGTLYKAASSFSFSKSGWDLPVSHLDTALSLTLS